MVRDQVSIVQDSFPILSHSFDPTRAHITHYLLKTCDFLFYA